MTSPELTDEFADEFLKNIYRLWLVPEVQRRLASGTISGETKIWAGQIIFEMDRPPEIRLNDEVNGTFHVRPDANLSEGAVLNAENAIDIAANVVGFELDDHDRPNGAHVTVLMGNAGFYINFDLRYNAAVVAELVLTAREFLEIARHAGSVGSSRAFVANLHVAVESLAKADLLLHPDNEILASKKHGFLRGRYNLHSKRGGTDKRFSKLLNKLDDLRNPARYGSKPPLVPKEEMLSLIEDADAMLGHVLAVSPGRAQRRSRPVA